MPVPNTMRLEPNLNTSGPPPTFGSPVATPGSRLGRMILHDRLVGEAARRRAMSIPPEGAGLSPEAASSVEYVEVWIAKVADGYDFRFYNFGGALIAARSTFFS